MAQAQGFYGSEHMLFGTDFPWEDTPRIIESIKGLDIPEEKKENDLWRECHEALQA